MRAWRQMGALAAAETYSRGVAWVTLFALPWLLSAEQYGIVVLIATFEGVATGFLLLGQDRAVLWRYADREVSEVDRSTVATAILITSSACILSAAAVLAVSRFTGATLLGVPVWPHLSLLAVAVVLVNVNRVAVAFARIAHLTREFVINRAATGTLKLVLTLGLGAGSGSSLAYPIGMAAGTAIGGARLWHRVIPRRWQRESIAREGGVLLRYGTPLSVHLLAMTSVRFVDRWIIGAFLGLAVVGSYGWYYMLGSAVTFVYAALSVYYEPEIYRQQQQTGSGAAVHEYLGATLMAAGIYGLIGCVAVVVASDLVPAMVKADPEIVRIVLVAHWLHPIYLVCNYLLSSVGRTLPIAVISIFTVGVAVVANLLLVPKLGAIGGAWATLIGAISLVLAAMLVVRTAGVRVRLRRSLAVVVGLGVLAVGWPSIWTLAVSSGGLVIYGASQADLLLRRMDES